MAKIQVTVTLKTNAGVNIAALNSSVKNTRSEAETEIGSLIQARVDAAGANLVQEQEAQNAFNS